MQTLLECPTPQFLAHLESRTAVYGPNDEILREAQRFHIAPIIGATGVGSTTVLEAAGIPSVGSITSRPMNKNESIGHPYRRHLNFDNRNERREVLTKLNEGLYVQASSYRAGGDFYASELHDYPRDEMSAMTLSADEFYKLRAKDLFGTFSGVHLVAPNYNSWQRRRRGPEDKKPPHYEERTVEAYFSVQRSLLDPSMPFVINEDGEALIAGNMINDLARGAMLPPFQMERGRRAAQLMIDGIRASGDVSEASLDAVDRKISQLTANSVR